MQSTTRHLEMESELRHYEPTQAAVPKVKNVLYDAQEQLYLLLVHNELRIWFNILCYDYNVYTIEDLKVFLQTDRLKEMNPVRYKTGYSQLLNIAKDSQNANYHNIVQYTMVEPNKYREFLQVHGIRRIEREEITIRFRLALNSKLCGTVYRAIWTKPNGAKVEVCLRYADDSFQEEAFLEEAKCLSRLNHENITQLYGVVVFSSYVNSVALVVEYAPKGSLMECISLDEVTSIRTVYSYACQMVAALDYLADNSVNLTCIRSFTFFVFDDQKIKFGGFQASLSKADHEILSTPNVPYFVSQYGYLLNHMYTSVLNQWLAQPIDEFGDFWNNNCIPLEMLEVIKCCTTDEDKPTLKEVVAMVKQRLPLLVRANTDYTAKHPIEMSFKRGDIITVISKAYMEDLWLGQKDDGEFGCFHRRDAYQVDDVQDDRVPAEIMARGPEAEHAYRKALLEGKVQVYRGRIMLIGQDRAGKTSLKKSLLGLPFNAEEPSTEGIEVDPSTFEVDVEQVSSWQRLCDVTKGGSQSERALARLIAEELSRSTDSQNSEVNEEVSSLVQHLEGRPLIYDETLEKLDNPPQEPDQEDKLLNLIAAETTNDERDLSKSLEVSCKVRVKLPEELVRLVAEFLRKKPLFEDQHHKETILDVWDFAGQHLYYATHPVFFSSRAVYVLTHNLSKDLRERAEPCMRQGVDTIKLDNANNETNLENLVSWLVTVHGIQKAEGESEIAELKQSKTPGSKLKYLRPPVVIVGTHADQPSMPVNEAHALLARAICGKTYDEHVIRPFFAVDNTRSSEDGGLHLLQKKIAQVLESEPYMGETLPAKWFNFEKAIKAQIENKVFHLPLEDCRRIAQTECFITDASEVDTMLNFYHDLRVIVKHGGTVVLQSQWLINLFRSLITIRTFTDMDPTHSKHWINLEKTGTLHSSLIDHVFGEAVGSEGAQKDLLSMMEHYGLLTKFTSSTPASDGSSTECVEYFVPAQLTSSPAGLVKSSPGDGDPCPLLIHFPDGFVPHGLFPRLVSRLICQFSEMGFSYRPSLFQNAARFIIGCNNNFDLSLLCCKRFIKVILRSVSTSRDQSMAIQVRMLLEDSLEDLSREWDWLGHMRTELCVECRACVPGLCENHVTTWCRDEDCLHVVAVQEQTHQPLICSRVFDDTSRFTLPGLRRWFTDEEEEKSAECIPKTGQPVREELTLLARDIGYRWKRLGRALELDEPELEQLEADERHLYERCYGVLRRWTEIQASNATYESLGRALLHQTVKRKDLALKYCGVVQA